MKYENKTVNYIGGSLKQGIVIDPDYMTWSMFDSFCEDNGIPGLVEHAHQDMGLVKKILVLNSDADINEMCATFLLTLVEFLKYGDLELQIWMLATPNQPQELLTFSRFCCMLCIHDHLCF